MTNKALVTIICALLASHYASTIWEIRKLQTEISELRRDVTTSALEAAKAATAAAQAAASVAFKR